MKALRFILHFVLSFAILAIPIGHGTIFSYMNNLIAQPITQTILSTSKHIVNQSVQWGRSAFTETIPQEWEDESQQKNKQDMAKEIKLNSGRASYTPEEQELLKKVLQQDQQ